MRTIRKVLKAINPKDLWIFILLLVPAIIVIVINALFRETYLPAIDDIEHENCYLVTEIVDGDTIKINYNGTTETVRLIGIDTPELNLRNSQYPECFAKEAKIKLESLIADQIICVENDNSQLERDKYDRLLFYIFRESDNLFINREMILEGFAYEYTYDTPYKYQSEFISAEDQAITQNLGLWSECD
ncbi:thermonuclease family protein [Candidatus Dojkabacteria bacterium]|nr:thermonuclease family protein [Candidatus Dojkabacteria bacterium]